MIQGSNDEDEYILHARCSEHGAFGREWACPRCFEEIQAWGEEIKARLARLERIEAATRRYLDARPGTEMDRTSLARAFHNAQATEVRAER